MREWHPSVSAVLLLALLLLSAFSTEPLVILCSLAGGISFCAITGGARRQLKTVLFVVAVFALTNPLFSHRGEHVLFYLNHNAVTLDALYEGARIGGMLAASLCWFSAFGRVLDGERVVYLLGRPFPKTALLISSALRMVSLAGPRHTAVKEARLAAGLKGEGALADLRFAAGNLSVSLGMTLENAVESGNSMKARGFGLPGRTAYGLFRFASADGVLIVAVILLAALAAAGILLDFAPLWACFGILCGIPCLLEGREKLRWRS